jgi:hypothetical protein
MYKQAYETGLCRKDDSPVVIVERLQLRKVTVEGGGLFRSYAPVCPDLEDFPCCSLSGTLLPMRGSAYEVLTGNHQILGTIIRLREDESCFY